MQTSVYGTPPCTPASRHAPAVPEFQMSIVSKLTYQVILWCTGVVVVDSVRDIILCREELPPQHTVWSWDITQHHVRSAGTYNHLLHLLPLGLRDICQIVLLRNITSLVDLKEVFVLRLHTCILGVLVMCGDIR